MPRLETKHVLGIKRMLGREQRAQSEARRNVVAGEQKHRGLTGRQKTSVRRAGDAAEFGEAPLHRAVLDEKDVEGGRTHGWKEGNDQHDPLFRAEAELAHDVRIGGARGRQFRRRERIERLRRVFARVLAQALLHELAEPCDLARDHRGVDGVVVHRRHHVM
jgi:hypothetical protein